MEVNRQLLEETNAIENAIAQRFRKNAALCDVASVAPPDSTLEAGPKRSYKETLGQAHELKYFASQYQHNCDRLKTNFSHGDLESSVSDMLDPNMTFAPLLSAVKDINDKFSGVAQTPAISLSKQYEMFSSAPSDELELKRKKRKVKRKYYLSSVTEFVSTKLATAFVESEMLGKYVDLTLFYDMYKSLSSSQATYPEYLRTFTEFKVVAKSHEYIKYLEALLLYLRNFSENALPLEEFKFEAKQEPDMKDGEENEKGEVFCKPCNKLFSKKTVYDGHLSGKKHKKLQAQSAGNPTPQAQRPSYQSMEEEIVQLSKHLAPIISLTANDHERRSRMFEREKRIELDAIEGNQSDFTSIESDDEQADSENDESDEELKGSYERDLPLGADGIPIPLWLYKLQGLHKSYSCEICGNQVYKGRQQFEKHFGLSRHLHGLKCLGVADTAVPLFANISNIEEAQQLWQSVKENLRAEEEETKDAIEVEDDNGNVMSHADYIELKKQGLI